MYHKIKPEDLNHGLNYQIKKVNVNNKEVFVEKRINMDKFFQDENFIIKDGVIENIRVRDLSEDEIKKEGWMKIRDNYYKFKLNELEYFFAYDPSMKMCNVFYVKINKKEDGSEVPVRGELFIGFIRNLSEFRMLMKFIGFKNGK